MLLPIVCTLIPLTSPAAITVLDYYRFGDADPGAVAGNPFNVTTVDSAGDANLTKKGAITYTSDVPSETVAGSPNAFAAAFSGAPFEDFSYLTRLTDAQDNFGLEMFVNSSSLTGNVGLASNGKSGSSGFGLVQREGQYKALLGTNPGTYFGSAPIVVGEWVHLALVRDAGLSTLYVNGVASQTSSAEPLFGSNPFRIGSSVGSDAFEGLIDEVRLFTFAPGEFTTSDLLVNQIPEPGAVGLLTSGAVYLVAMRRRTGKTSGSRAVHSVTK